jgi:hypothetical protein
MRHRYKIPEWGLYLNRLAPDARSALMAGRPAPTRVQLAQRQYSTVHYTTLQPSHI